MNWQGLELSVPLGVSGKFLYDRGRFTVIRKSLKEFNHLCSLINEIERQLGLINNPEWLVVFERRCRRSASLTAIPDRSRRLEDQRKNLISRKETIKEELLNLEPHIFDVRQSLVGFVSQSSVPYKRKPTGDPNAEVQTRNVAIDCSLNESKSDAAICDELDELFQKSGNRPAKQLPDTWFRRFDVTTFAEAYQHPQCRALVSTMISKRRRLMAVTCRDVEQ